MLIKPDEERAAKALPIEAMETKPLPGGAPELPPFTTPRN
jgi:hypothetical protein